MDVTENAYSLIETFLCNKMNHKTIIMVVMRWVCNGFSRKNGKVIYLNIDAKQYFELFKKLNFEENNNYIHLLHSF